MKHQIKLKIPNDFIEERWIKETALMLSVCCYEKIVWNNNKPMCSLCKLETKIIN